MSSKLADILNEMSLLLVMTSEGDEPGIKMLREYCGDIVQLEKGNPDDKELIYACESVSGKESSPEFFAAIQKFVPAALNHLERPGEGTFPDLTSNAASASANTINTDLADSVDQRFLTEYIEIHTLQLEEFEASLMEHEFKGGDVSEFTTNVKRYLHSLKGDSGSIGLIGVEKVCHF
ncbi:MAG: hypothetical protein DCC75_11075, partial [Proteobacteria bacterium]